MQQASANNPALIPQQNHIMQNTQTSFTPTTNSTSITPAPAFQTHSNVFYPTGADSNPLSNQPQQFKRGSSGSNQPAFTPSNVVAQSSESSQAMGVAQAQPSASSNGVTPFKITA